MAQGALNGSGKGALHGRARGTLNWTNDSGKRKSSSDSKTSKRGW